MKPRRYTPKFILVALCLGICLTSLAYGDDGYTPFSPIELELGERETSACDSVREMEYFLLGMLDDYFWGREYIENWDLVESFASTEELETLAVNIFVEVGRRVLIMRGLKDDVQVVGGKEVHSKNLLDVLNWYFDYLPDSMQGTSVTIRGREHRVRRAFRFSRKLDYTSTCEKYAFLRGVYLRRRLLNEASRCDGEPCLVFVNSRYYLHRTVAWLLERSSGVRCRDLRTKVGPGSAQPMQVQFDMNRALQTEVIDRAKRLVEEARKQ